MFRAEVAQPLDEAGQRQAWTLLAALFAMLFYCYWNSLRGLAEIWGDPTYNHGWIIPLGAAFLLWYRRQPFTATAMAERWWGAGLVALGTGIRLWGTHHVQFTLDRASFIVCLLGIFVLVGGIRTLRWAGAPVVFLLLMYPWPRVMEDRLMHPLKTLATMTSVYALQTLGIETYREGNVVNLGDQSVGVVEQCSGLRMLTIFVGMSIFMALIMRERPLWERIGVVFSSVPIALLANVFRVTLTCVLYSLDFQEGFGNKLADHVFHDFAGLLMMPIAIVLLIVVTKILSHVVIEEEPPPALPTGIGQLNY